jgi:hypothetical protein|nr:MAG TPA: hypothetical protein [Caudoviricetes sp.]
MLRFIKLEDTRIDINQIKSYSYRDGSLFIETENDYFSYDKKDIPELDDVVDLMDANLCLNHPVNAIIEEEE